MKSNQNLANNCTDWYATLIISRIMFIYTYSETFQCRTHKYTSESVFIQRLLLFRGWFLFVLRPTQVYFTCMEMSPIAGEWLQVLTYTRHVWPLSSEGSWTCPINCDTGLSFYCLRPKDRKPIRPLAGLETMTSWLRFKHTFDFATRLAVKNRSPLFVKVKHEQCLWAELKWIQSKCFVNLKPKYHVEEAWVTLKSTTGPSIEMSIFECEMSYFPCCWFLVKLKERDINLWISTVSM